MKSDLHTFIHSLTQNEKRYFKLQASLGFEGTRKSYWQLYELIHGQKNYDEKSIKSQIGSHRFAQQKKDLEEKLLESLRNYHAGKTVVELVNFELKNYRIYSEKGLSKRAVKCLIKAEELARRYEMYPELLRIFEDSIPIIVNSASPSQIKAQIQSIRQEIPIIQQKIELSFLIQQDYLYFITLNKENEFLRREEVANAALDLISQLSDKISNCNLSALSQAQFHYLCGLGYFLCGQFSESQNAFFKEFQTYEQFPIIKTTQKDSYVKCLGNNALLSITLSQEAKLDSWFSTNTKINILEHDNNIVVLYEHILNIRLFIKKSQWLTAFQYILKNLDLKGQSLSIFNQISMKTEADYMFFDILRIYLEMNEYYEANQHLNYYLNNVDVTQKIDNYIMARIVFVYLQLIQREFSVAESEWRSLKRFIKKNKRDFIFEKLNLKCLSRLILHPIKEKQQKILQKFILELENLKMHREGRMTMFTFDLSEWLKGVNLMRK